MTFQPGGGHQPGSATLLGELLGRGQRATLRARGGSMWPFLRDGDVVTLAPLTAPILLGEVLLARRGDELVLHRAVRLTEGGPVLRGDALPREDGVFPAAQLLGRVVRLRRAGHAGRGYPPARLFALAMAPACRLWLRVARRARSRRSRETPALR